MQAVYLLHFERPINPNRPAQHYLGYASNVHRRIRQHRNGTGSRLCEVAKERGIEFTVAREWYMGDRKLERQLKKQKNSKRLCPLCNFIGWKL